MAPRLGITPKTEPGRLPEGVPGGEGGSASPSETAPNSEQNPKETPDSPSSEEKTYIKWVDFSVPAAVMKKALDYDISSHSSDGEGAAICWIDLLSYLAAKYGGNFGLYKAADLEGLISRLESGETMASIGEGMKYFSYYQEAYTAVLGGFVGYYTTFQEEGTEDGEKKYGLHAYHPLARGFDYQHYDDFGNGRSYGYKRKHLGHDLMALTGTPVVAVESGVVEELGWNQYGGWRVGIRSFDGKRYYYYAHLRQNRPYAQGLEKGGLVQSGDVIGYVGRTGYSRRENTNGITQSHLHFGLQLIFDESQKDGVNQIWVDVYEITKLLQSRRCDVVRDGETKEFTRKFREEINTGPSLGDDCKDSKPPIRNYP